MLEIITAPDKNLGNPKNTKLFLGGGITGTSEWQAEFLKELKNELPAAEEVNLTIYNPRRIDFDTSKIETSIEQIEWEYNRLRVSNAKMFYFTQTLCPITLFELGRHLDCPSLFVGCDKDYARLFDVQYQLKLARPNVKVAIGLHELLEQVQSFVLKECW